MRLNLRATASGRDEKKITVLSIKLQSFSVRQRELKHFHIQLATCVLCSARANARFFLPFRKLIKRNFDMKLGTDSEIS